MSNYEFSNRNGEPSKESPYIGYGSGQVLKINSIELKFSQASGSPKAILHMESKPVTSPGFTPVDGAKGKVGRVGGSIYMKDDKLKEGFMDTLYKIATALGVQEEIGSIKGDTFQDVIKQAEKVVCGPGKWARYTILAEEYLKKDGKTGIALALPKYNFVESVDTEPSGLLQFDKSNKWHYRKVQAPASVEDETNDLPF